MICQTHFRPMLLSYRHLSIELTGFYVIGKLDINGSKQIFLLQLTEVNILIIGKPFCWSP